MRRAAAAGALLVAVSSCFTVPITGRKSLNLLTPQQEVEVGTQYYQDMLAEEQPVRSGPEADRVERVMQRLVAVADAPDYPWEVTLIRNDSTANAFALPGGKMAVYTGILPVTQDEAGLAAVMGHEIGHVIARHGAERLTTEGLAENLLALARAHWGGSPEVYQAGKTVLLTLPYGRKQELEADHIGLILMARAGYDPRRAVDFWQRMAAQSKGSPPEFLSTHPSGATRIADLKKLLPEALEVHRRSGARP
ncbi:MAG TPA: M48 family metallopeptidase [Planctomycetota bacterium]|nr:M48 family metallopeptidase [Planctomycetota bacterium]